MTVYPLGNQRLIIRRNLALVQVKSTKDWRTVAIYKLPVIAYELSEASHLGRFVAIYEAENNSVDLREHLTVYRKGK